jgi:pimeloyl-ACP methyl ester carboxylesterase
MWSRGSSWRRVQRLAMPSVMAGLLLLGGLSPALAEQPAAPLQLAGTSCETLPTLRCPDENCPTDLVIDPGPVQEPETGRHYFLDYPCDLQPGEPVHLILSLHGGGSFGNWQRHYFPAVDYVDELRLVIATPNTRAWSPADDDYLHNIVSTLIEDLGAGNIQSFWLVGHSMGSFNSRRLVCTPFFRDKVDGYVSLSGGRVGSPPGPPAAGFRLPPVDDAIAAAQASAAESRQPPSEGPASGAPPSLFAAAASITLDCDFSFIFSAGEHEPSAQNLAETSSWAERYGCGPREQIDTVSDSRAGYVYDASRQQHGTDAWGRLPGPGDAEVMQYSSCNDNRLVADVIRLGKGHTEGLEPNVTRHLLQMMLAAPGGKLQRLAH